MCCLVLLKVKAGEQTAFAHATTLRAADGSLRRDNCYLRNQQIEFKGKTHANAAKTNGRSSFKQDQLIGPSNVSCRTYLRKLFAKVRDAFVPIVPMLNFAAFVLLFACTFPFSITLIMINKSHLALVSLYTFSVLITVLSEPLPDLPSEHYAFYLRNNFHHFTACKSHSHCKSLKLTEQIVNSSCWGYEDECTDKQRYSVPGENSWMRASD